MAKTENHKYANGLYFSLICVSFGGPADTFV